MTGRYEHGGNVIERDVDPKIASEGDVQQAFLCRVGVFKFDGQKDKKKEPDCRGCHQDNGTNLDDSDGLLNGIIIAQARTGSLYRINDENNLKKPDTADKNQYKSHLVVFFLRFNLRNPGNKVVNFGSFGFQSAYVRKSPFDEILAFNQLKYLFQDKTADTATNFVKEFLHF